MQFEDTPTFGIVDYCMFAAMLLFSVGIGIYMSFKGNKSPEDYLMGSRSFGPIPVSLSLLTSYLSAIGLLGFSGEVYAHGLQFSLFVVGSILGMVTSIYFSIPVFYPLKLTSINEYIELRFKSPRLRSFIMIISCISSFIYMGVCLYAPTVALASITPVDSLTYILVLGGVCAFYSTIGGIRAVVWTDVFQFAVMLIGLIVVSIVGCIEVGGFGKVWTLASEGGRTNIFNMNPSIYERHTFYNVQISGFLLSLASYSTSQVFLQRISAVQSLRDAKQILILNIFGKLLLFSLIFFTGLIGFAVYNDCDPWLEGKIKRKEEILPYFVVDRLSYILGLPGLFVATLVAGTLSTISSVISALVAMIWKEACSLSKKIDNLSTRTATLINKCLSMLIGAAVIGMAIVASKATSLIQFSLTVMGVNYGPVFGVFILGLLFPRCNIIGVWSGLLVSWFFLCWTSIGGYLYLNNPESLPFSTAACNFTLSEIITQQSYEPWNINMNDSDNHSLSMAGDTPTSSENNFPLMKLYAISYTWYSVIGPIVCVVLAMIISYITGLEDAANVAPELTATFIRKYYWKKRELGIEDPKQVKLINNDLERAAKEERRDLE